MRGQVYNGNFRAHEDALIEQIDRSRSVKRIIEKMRNRPPERSIREIMRDMEVEPSSGDMRDRSPDRA